jgi:hypothetical protein
VVRLWGLFEIASSYRQTVYLKRRRAGCASAARERFAGGCDRWSAHLMVVVARCGRTASTASAMIETLGMMIVVQGTNGLTTCRIGTAGFEGWSGCSCVESARRCA